MPRRENKVTPKVISRVLYADESFALESLAWWQWLNLGRSFYVQMLDGGYTARRELRRGSYFWYAFKRSAGKLYKVYIGRSHELTAARLSEVSSLMEGRIQAAHNQ